MSASREEIAAAKVIYKNLLQALDEFDLKYDNDDENMRVDLRVTGDDLPMDFIIMVRPEKEVVSLFSIMPFHAKEDKRVDMALAVVHANYGLVSGTFDYDLTDGEIRFRMSQRFEKTVLHPEIFKTMLAIASHTVDDYNDKFMMLNNGMIDLEKFMEVAK